MIDATFQGVLDATQASCEDKVYVIGPAKAETVDKDKYVDSDEDQTKEKPKTASNTYVLWVPAAYTTELARVEEEAAGNNVAAFEALMKALKTQKTEYSGKFATALAVTTVASRDVGWMDEDTDKGNQVVKNLGNFWRTTLLKKSDKQLGLGSSPDDEESREALYALLGKCQSDLDTEGDGSTFNWQPAKERKPRKGSGRTNSEKSDS